MIARITTSRLRWAVAALIGAGAAYGASWLIPPLYQAESAVVVLPGPTVASSVGIGSGMDFIRSNPALEGFEAMEVVDYLQHLLESRSAADRVADQLNLAADPNFCPRRVSRERLIKRLRRAVKVSQDLGLISTRARARTPALAARIANCFVENMGRLVHSRSHQRRRFIEDQLALRRRELARAEEALRDFQHLNRSIALQKEAEEQVKALVGLATERESARIAMAENRAGVGVAGAIPDLVRLRAEKETIRARQRGLSEAIGRVEDRLAALPDQGLVLARLTEEVEAKRNLVELLTRQWESSKIAEREEQDKYQWVDAAVPPEKPVFPNKPLNALLGAFAGAALGLLAGRRRA